MTKLKAEVERLEEFSRRDNLRMYGITSQEGLEPRGLRHLCPGSDRRSQQRGGTQEMDDGRHCPSTPNRPKSGRTAKAHDRQVQPLERQNDSPIKSTVQRQPRARHEGCKRQGHRNQAAIVAAVRRDGKVAFFKKGKLTVEPRRPDSRAYAKVTTTDDAGATTNPAQEQSADRVNVGGQMPREDSCRDGDSPRVNNSGGERAIPARANRGGAQSERGPRQSGLSDYWASRRSPPRSPGNKCQGRNAQPRRSKRASTRRR